jgi:hypothetical protein
LCAGCLFLRIKTTFGLCIVLAACATRKPVSANWRLVNQDAAVTLIPPGADPNLTQREIAVKLTAADGACPATVRKRKHRLSVNIDRDSFANRPQGWLTTWTASLESDGCLAPGQAPLVATRIAESIPLDPEIVRRVLYPNDLVPPVRLEVVSPILRDPAASGTATLIAPAAETGTGLSLTLRSSDNLVGYETALYAVQPKAGGGHTIAPLYADRHIRQQTEHRAQPATNYFSFAPDAAFYRLFVKSGQTDFTALVIAAPTRVELDRDSALLDSGRASCEKLPPDHCVAIPRRVAINAVTAITVNGAETFARWGATVAEAIRAAGIPQPETLLPRLAVSRLYDGRSTPIDFDRTSPAVLRLPLMGGEVIAWSQE